MIIQVIWEWKVQVHICVIFYGSQRSVDADMVTVTYGMGHAYFLKKSLKEFSSPSCSSTQSHSVLLSWM